MKLSAAVTAILSVAAIALSACGGDDGGDGPSASDRDKFQKAALDHAKCLREHGLDVPDPQFDGGKVTMERRGEPGDEATARRAEEACAHILENAPRPEVSPEQEAKAREQALEHAQCMREHGIDFPDPQIDGGRIQQRIGGGINPEDPKFQQAQKDCGGGMMMREGTE